MGNLWERQQNRRARQKKERAKARGFSISQNTADVFVNHTTEGSVGIVIGIRRDVIEIKHDGVVQMFQQDDKISVTIGDHILLDLVEKKAPKIIGRLPRKNVVARLRGDWTRNNFNGFGEHALAANVDYGVIVVSAKNPVFHPRFIDRYLIALENGGVSPLICITKGDLASKIDESRELYGALGIPMYEVSIVSGAGMDKLKDALRSKVVVFLGQSGVGKSSLLHEFVPIADIRTQEVSKKTGTGKHTTSVSKMYEWAPDSFIIDTPGIRSLGFNIPKERLRTFFHEFDRPAQYCRFRDCMHDKEEDCAVKDAVKEGAISKARYESYIRLLHD